MPDADAPMSIPTLGAPIATPARRHKPIRPRSSDWQAAPKRSKSVPSRHVNHVARSDCPEIRREPHDSLVNALEFKPLFAPCRHQATNGGRVERLGDSSRQGRRSCRCGWPWRNCALAHAAARSSAAAPCTWRKPTRPIASRSSATSPSMRCGRSFITPASASSPPRRRPASHRSSPSPRRVHRFRCRRSR